MGQESAGVASGFTKLPVFLGAGSSSKHLGLLENVALCGSGMDVLTFLVAVTLQFPVTGQRCHNTAVHIFKASGESLENLQCACMSHV